MVEVDTVSEVIVYVQDIDRLTSFYADAFDLSIVGGAPEHGFVRFDTGQCSLCLHEGGDGESGNTAPKVVFAVDDVEAARADLLVRDVEVGEIRSPVPGTRVCDGFDPEGNRFAIESRTEE